MLLRYIVDALSKPDILEKTHSLDQVTMKSLESQRSNDVALANNELALRLMECSHMVNKGQTGPLIQDTLNALSLYLTGKNPSHIPNGCSAEGKTTLYATLISPKGNGKILKVEEKKSNTIEEEISHFGLKSLPAPFATAPIEKSASSRPPDFPIKQKIERISHSTGSGTDKRHFRKSLTIASDRDQMIQSAQSLNDSGTKSSNYNLAMLLLECAPHIINDERGPLIQKTNYALTNYLTQKTPRSSDRKTGGEAVNTSVSLNFLAHPKVSNDKSKIIDVKTSPDDPRLPSIPVGTALSCRSPSIEIRTPSTSLDFPPRQRMERTLRTTGGDIDRFRQSGSEITCRISNNFTMLGATNKKYDEENTSLIHSQQAQLLDCTGNIQLANDLSPLTSIKSKSTSISDSGSSGGAKNIPVMEAQAERQTQEGMLRQKYHQHHQQQHKSHQKQQNEPVVADKSRQQQEILLAQQHQKGQRQKQQHDNPHQCFNGYVSPDHGKSYPNHSQSTYTNRQLTPPHEIPEYYQGSSVPNVDTLSNTYAVVY